MAAAVPELPLLALCRGDEALRRCRALDRVDFELRAGEIHALLGETVPASPR